MVSRSRDETSPLPQLFLGSHPADARLLDGDPIAQNRSEATDSYCICIPAAYNEVGRMGGGADLPRLSNKMSDD